MDGVYWGSSRDGLGLSMRNSKDAGYIHRHETLGVESTKDAASCVGIYRMVLTNFDRHNKSSAL